MNDIKYWWDFVENATFVIVQGSRHGQEELARFPVDGEDASGAIDKAESLISDLYSGRKTVKSLGVGKP